MPKKKKSVKSTIMQYDLHQNKLLECKIEKEYIQPRAVIYCRVSDMKQFTE